MTNFKKWTKPGTNEKRIYISGLPNQSSAKVFVVENQIDEFGFNYDIRAQIPEGISTDRNFLINEAEKAIFESAQSRVKNFKDVELLCGE